MTKIEIQRFAVPQASLPADNNIRHQYPIHRGQWVRHPEQTADEQSFCRFFLDFVLEVPATIDIHVSADNRFELYCDDTYVGMGPDRSDIEHWSFHSYRLRLDAGPHRLSADHHYLGLNPAGRPWAQTCIEPGFVLYAENSPVDLNTGSAPWQVSRLQGVSTTIEKLNAFFVVGPNYTIDATGYFAPPPAVPVVNVRDAGRQAESGTIHPGWKLFPSSLPEQVRRPVGGGAIRCVTNITDDAPFPNDKQGEDLALHTAWQALVDGNAGVTVPPHTRVVVLWDLQQYHTAYPELTTADGSGARVQIKWAESLYLRPNDAQGISLREKGQRDQIAGKYFRGNGDTFLPDGARRTFRPFWWRAGRFVKIVVETNTSPLTIQQLRLLETRMPLENEAVFDSSDAGLAPVVDVCARGIQMCAHETYMDCPYYEQMMYVGDTRLQILTSFIMSSEDRLNRRALELFDWSRQQTGFVMERYPSQPKQLSCTFAMIWILMIRDYAWWRDDGGFVRQRLKGMRCMLEEFKALSGNADPLLPALPGWSFMDWVEGLSFVNNPGSGEGLSGVVNLLFLNALSAAADLEAEFGEAHLADYDRKWAARLAASIEAQFWDQKRGMFAEDREHKRYSEHAQCLALLSGHFPDHEQRCLHSLIAEPDLLRTTVYFSFYLLDVLAKYRRGDLIQQKLTFWKEMAGMGLKTPVEMPEPTRSDCHGWSSHPLFHMHASLAGIRPSSPGFAKVHVAPSPGSLTRIASSIPHPAGRIGLSMELVKDSWAVQVALPGGIAGTFEWQGRSYPLRATTQLNVPAAN